jgi:hypothetical protein
MSSLFIIIMTIKYERDKVLSMLHNKSRGEKNMKTEWLTVNCDPKW